MVLEKVKALASEQFDIEEDEITPDTTFEELGAEPDDVVDFMLALNDEFDIDLSDTPSDRILTVGDAVRLVEEMLGRA